MRAHDHRASHVPRQSPQRPEQRSYLWPDDFVAAEQIHRHVQDQEPRAQVPDRLDHAPIELRQHGTPRPQVEHHQLAVFVRPREPVQRVPRRVQHSAP